MSSSEMSPLPDHRSCRALTEITIEYVRRNPSIGRRRAFTKGSSIWSPADAADRIFFLELGEVAIIASDAEGREFIMHVVRSGAPFGELCFCSVTDNRRHSFSRAVVDSNVVEISYSDFYTFLQTDREALMALTYTFCIRLSAAEERVNILTHRDAVGRLGRLLISLATADSTDPNATRVMLHVSHNELAQMAAMNRSHVTVTLGNFRKQGLVDYERGRPLAVNVQKLMVYLQLDPR